MADFLYHKVSENEKEEIKKEAKKIIDKFSRRLSIIKKSVKEPLIERVEWEREEGEKSGEDFSREIMFENAPKKNKNSIISEKKQW